MMLDPDCFVRWPDDEDWADDHRGGLFAYLVYRAVGTPDRATVDVFPHLGSPAMALPDALLRQLWAPPVTGRPVQLGDGEGPLHPWSTSLRAVVWLGSTPRTLRHRVTGRGFQVRREDLTRDGDAVAHCMDHVYGLEGDILTFAGAPCEPPPLASWLAVQARRVMPRSRRDA